MGTPFRSSKSYRFLLQGAGMLLGLVLLCSLLGPGFKRLFKEVDLPNFAKMPVTPLSELKQWSGTNQLVRVRARMLGDPGISDRAGEKLAYKGVVQRRSTRGGYSIDDSWWTPSQFEVGDGSSRMLVDLQHHAIDYRFVPERLKGYVPARTVPDDVAALLTPDFEELKPIRGNTMVVYTIAAGEMVTIFGVVEMLNDRLVIRPSARQSPIHLILSPMPEEKLNQRLQSGNFGFGVVALMILVAGFSIWLATRLKRKRLLAATMPRGEAV